MKQFICKILDLICKILGHWGDVKTMEYRTVVGGEKICSIRCNICHKFFGIKRESII